MVTFSHNEIKYKVYAKRQIDFTSFASLPQAEIFKLELRISMMQMWQKPISDEN